MSESIKNKMAPSQALRIPPNATFGLFIQLCRFVGCWITLMELILPKPNSISTAATIMMEDTASDPSANHIVERYIAQWLLTTI